MFITINPDRVRAVRDSKIYGQFIEHFHRQIYGGIFDPASPLADGDGFREDVLEALREIRVPVVRWPGGCFVSAYDWKKGVGPRRVPVFDKAWRVEEPNTFGTDEFIAWCRKLGCVPYICTNAGTGTEAQMSDWMEYCNLPQEGEYARMRITNGHAEPYAVPYWSIGNENYGSWEIGAKDADAWGRLVLEASKMLKRVDPTAELSAAALPDPEWNFKLLSMAGERLSWISIHSYWDALAQEDNPADYEGCMAYTADLDSSVRKVRGMLCALGLEKQIAIAYDEWNLRGWHHPNALSVYQGRTKEEYLTPRDRNDRNTTYTMADTIFTACFLNMVLRNADIVRMANFSAVVNTRGLLATYPDGIVRRGMYHVFKLYTRHMFDQVIDLYADEAPEMTVRAKSGEEVRVPRVDCVATRDSATGAVAVSAVNKHPSEPIEIRFRCPGSYAAPEVRVIRGTDVNDYNDIGRETIRIERQDALACWKGDALTLKLPAHAICVATLRPEQR